MAGFGGKSDGVKEGPVSGSFESRANSLHTFDKLDPALKLKYEAKAVRTQYMRSKELLDGINPKGEDESDKPKISVLNSKEKEKYHKIFAEVVESPDLDKGSEQTKSVLRDIFSEEVFKTKYTESGGWKDQYYLYANDPNKDPNQQILSENEFITAKAIEFILDQRNQLIEERTNNILAGDLTGKKVDPKQEEERQSKINAEIKVFLATEELELLSLNEFDEQAKEAKIKLYLEEFGQIFKQNGCEYNEKDQELINGLFNRILEDVNVAAKAIADIQDPKNGFQQLIGKTIQESQIAQQQAPLVAPLDVTSSVGSNMNFVDSPIFKNAGVSLEPAPGKGEGVYKIQYDQLQNRIEYTPLIRIVVDKRHPENLKFQVEQQYADEVTANGKPIDGFPTATCDKNSLSSALNLMALDYYLNVEIRTKDKISPRGGEDPNKIIKDFRMVKMAELLFGKSLNDHKITEPNLALYRRFLVVLLDDKQGGALSTRVDSMYTALQKPDLLPFIQELLDSNGRFQGNKLSTVNGLLNAAHSLSEGNKPDQSYEGIKI